ncbi:MAG: hypothetical protein QOE68_1363, partial [Thermoanaerobaculia bacterium]|nr:hypothetical protein [Thermoanaerobaculia bacterium]
IIDSIDEDLQLLIDQLASESAMTDVRITVEHLVLLLGRAFPLINSVVADLYMTQVADIERAASEVLPQRILDTSAQFRSLQDGLRKSELPRDADRREQITIILDSAAAMAAIHLTCLTVLRELIGTPV